MTPAETATILRQFNKWLRGNKDDPQLESREINQAINAAIEMIERLEAAEKERDALRAENERMDEAMESLLIRCDDSDSAMYGTLSTSFVRDTVRIARAAPEESK